ncbi:MAG: orotate phosphoribosyltransferase [Acidobacteriota bacterium]
MQNQGDRRVDPHRGRDLRSKNRRRLRQILLQRCYLKGRFRLASGATSNLYFDCKRATLDPEGIGLVADLMLDLVADLKAAGKSIEAVGGPSIGADPIAAGMALRSYQRGCPLPAFLLRSAVKDHGTARLMENDIPEGSPVLLVEDVVTSGGSALAAAETLAHSGYQVAAVACVVDRQQGGAAALAPHRLHALFTRADLEESRS